MVRLVWSPGLVLMPSRRQIFFSLMLSVLSFTVKLVVLQGGTLPVPRELTPPPNPSQLIALQLTISVYRKNWIIFTEVLDVKHELYIPYHVIKPVLNRCTPEQLKSIQWKNSYLRADTDELWKNFCVQHLQNCDKHYDDDEAEDGDEIGWQRKFYV